MGNDIESGSRDGWATADTVLVLGTGRCLLYLVPLCNFTVGLELEAPVPVKYRLFRHNLMKYEIKIGYV